MVAFVILHYMASDETISCVDSILNNVEGEKKIIVVDNASPNGSIKELKQKYDSNDSVDVIGSDENLGFAKGNNIGYKHAVEKYAPEFVVVMNNDMEILQSDFIDGICKSYDEYAYSIMGPDIYSTKKEYHQNPQTRKMPTENDLKKSYKQLMLRDKLRFIIPIKWWAKKLLKKQPANEKRRNVPFVETVVEDPLLHGSCYVFSPLFIKNHPTECFYNKTFMYLEAEILYYQAKRDGEKMVYYPFIKVFHHEDVATDLEYKKQYKKSIFSVKCLLQSTKAFLELIEQDKK